MKPFIMVSTRPELEAAHNEYESFLALSGLARGDLNHVLIEDVDFLDAFAAGDVSGVLIGGSPHDAYRPLDTKTRSQERVEEQVTELLAVALKEAVPVLATGFGLEVLAGYLGVAASPEFGEELGAADIFVTAEGRADPLLEGLPQAFSAMVGHHNGVGELPPHATLLASSPDCPVEMMRVGESVYGAQFNPELDAERFAQRISVYTDAGYGDPGPVEGLFAHAHPASDHVAGRVIRNFANHFARD